MATLRLRTEHQEQLNNLQKSQRPRLVKGRKNLGLVIAVLNQFIAARKTETPAGTSPTPARRRAGPTQRSGVRVGARARSRSDFGRPDEPARRSRVGRSVLSRLTPAPRGRPTASPICFGSQHF